MFAYLKAIQCTDNTCKYQGHINSNIYFAFISIKHNFIYRSNVNFHNKDDKIPKEIETKRTMQSCRQNLVINTC